jgi:hypothetical protein
MLIRKAIAMSAPITSEDAASVPHPNDDHIVYTPTADTDDTSRFVLRTSSHMATTTRPS